LKSVSKSNRKSSLIGKIGTGLLFTIIIAMFAIWASSSFFITKEANKALAPYKVQLSPDSDITFNPFIFSVTIDDAALVKDGEKTAHIKSAVIDLNIFSVLATNIAFDELIFNDVLINAEKNSQATIVAGINLEELPKSEESNETVKNSRGVDLSELQLNNVVIQFNDDKKQQVLQIKSLNNNLLSLGPYTQAIDVELSASLNEAPIELVVKGDIFDNQGEAYTKLTAQQLGLSSFAHYLPKEITKLSGVTNLTISSNFKLRKSEILANIVNLSLLFEQLNLSTAKQKVSLAALGLESESTDITVNRENLSDVETRVSADFSLSKLMVESAGNDQQLLAVESAKTGTINARVGDGNILVNVPTVDISLIDVLKGASDSNTGTLLQVGQVAIAPISFKKKKLTVGDITVSDLVSNITLDENGQLMGLPVEQPKEDVADNRTSKKERAKARLNKFANNKKKTEKQRFKVANIQLGNDANIYFNDRSVKSANTQHVVVNKLHVKNFTNTGIEPQTDFNLQAILNDDTKLKLAGMVAPFEEQLDLKLQSSLSELSLPDVSPYSAKAAGVGFLSGQLDSSTKLTINNNELTGETNIELRGVELASQSENSNETSSAISLNTALGMLKDSNGNVSLNIPMSGNISDPEFGLGSFVSIVTQKAVLAATETYLIQTFVPYANIVSIARVAGATMLKVNIEDLIYPAQQTKVDASQMQFVGELVNLLNDKPDAQLKICAYAVSKDASQTNASNSELMQVARVRGQALKALLITDKGIASKRLLLCQPQVDNSDGALPRIEFEM